MPKTQKELISNLSEKYGLEEREIERITHSQFKLVARTMAAGKFESVRLPLLGVFQVNPKRVEHVNNAKRKSTEASR